MTLRPFALERYFAPHEHRVPFLFSSSDCEPLSLERLLTLADLETRELWNDLRLGYTESQGLLALRQEIANLYVTVSADDVVVVVPEEGILLAMHAVLQSGDHVITMFPGYQSLYEVARDIGCAIDHHHAFDKAASEIAGVLDVDTVRCRIHGDEFRIRAERRGDGRDNGISGSIDDGNSLVPQIGDINLVRRRVHGHVKRTCAGRDGRRRVTALREEPGCPVRRCERRERSAEENSDQIPCGHGRTTPSFSGHTPPGEPRNRSRTPLMGGGVLPVHAKSAATFPHLFIASRLTA